MVIDKAGTEYKVIELYHMRLLNNCRLQIADCRLPMHPIARRCRREAVAALVCDRALYSMRLLRLRATTTGNVIIARRRCVRMPLRRQGADLLYSQTDLQ
jgi:hypothetical protein